MATDPIFLGVQSRGTLALPPALRRRHGLDKPGAQVEVTERADGVIELRPHVAVPQDQAWFWAQQWQQGEAEVNGHIAAARVSVSDSPDEFFDDLEKHTKTRK